MSRNIFEQFFINFVIMISGGIKMKKLTLLLMTCFVISPAFAGNFSYSKIGNSYIYSNTPMRYSVTARNMAAKSIPTNVDSQTLSALLAGAGLASGRISLLNTPSIKTSSDAARAFLDPYIVNINGNNYVLVKDSKDNNWTVENILGYGDSKDDLFASLKALESDSDTTKISAKELKKANIRFVLLNADGSLALENRNFDFDLSKVVYIDMNNLRTALGNKNQDGTFGYFYVIAKDGNQKRAYAGRVTFEDKQELKKYIK